MISRMTSLAARVAPGLLALAIPAPAEPPAPPPAPAPVVAPNPLPVAESAPLPDRLVLRGSGAPARPLGAISVWKEAADNLDHVTVTVSPGYDVVISGPQVEGTGAFHLAHPQPASQVILLDPEFDIREDTRLFFESRLGWATTGQVARAELSVNQGASWTPVWSRPGTGDSGQGGFHRIEIPLGETYAGQLVRLRFHYAFAGGSYYPQTDPHVGWLLDDIQVGPEYVIDPAWHSIGQPTDLEQQNLEMINRARRSASEEAIRLRDTTDPHVVAAMTYFQVDPVLLVEQFGELPESLPPLAFNENLLAAARLHSWDMLWNEFQGHVSSADPPPPNEPFDTLPQRIQRQGYQYQTIGENVFAYAQSVWHAHAGFNIDWGTGAQGSIGGMQNPPGHRLAIHHAGYREIGIGLVEGSSGPVGPMLVTQNFGVEIGRDQPFITGAAWEDLDGNDFYDPGEGLAGIVVTVDGNRFGAVTAGSGGYAVPVPGNGVYTVRFGAPGFPGWIAEVTVTNGHSVKLDYRLDQIPPILPPVIQAVMRHPADAGLLRIFCLVPSGIPILQTSVDLAAWEDLPGVPPVGQGGDVHLFEPPVNGTRRFYRVRLDP